MTMDDLIADLKMRQGRLSPQLRKIARFVIDNPGDVGVSSLRQIAERAGVKPNALVRLARAFDFDTYEEFRRPFRDAARQEVESYSERARWLQQVSRGNGGDDLFAQMAAALSSNLSFIFQTIDPVKLRQAANIAVKARTCRIIGLGSCYPPLLEFYYIARMALKSVSIVAPHGGFVLDDLLDIGADDVVIAATYLPYRRETIEAVEYAISREAMVIGITDRQSSPLATHSSMVFVAPSSTPQFFPSTLALSAVLEILLAFMVAEAGADSLERIETFHRLRIERSVYWEDG